MARVAINRCYGGFGLSDKAYEWMIAQGVPVRKYLNQQCDPETGLFLPEPQNDGEVIFDRELTPKGECDLNDLYYKYPSASSRYWETWTRNERSHPLVLGAIDALGAAANGRCADLAIIDVPDGVEFTIEEYDGMEHVAEKHRTWA